MPKIKILAKLRIEDKKLQKTGGKCDICEDLGVTKKNILVIDGLFSNLTEI